MTHINPEHALLQEGAQQAAAFLRALGNESRLLVLCLLGKHGELSVGALQAEVGLGQSALSQHLARLREDGLVASRREGQTVYYRIDDPRAGRMFDLLAELFCP